MKISNFSQGRDNNFNLIRILAAFAVLVTHSFALAIGTPDAEPFRAQIGMTMGAIAVDIFFVTSGFLVTFSLMSRQCTVDFIWARVLRIYPALLVMLFMTVFVMGLLLTSLTTQNYLTSHETFKYLAKCASLVTGVAYNLPGVFDDNPIKYAVNGSLWTMPNEIRLYILLAIIWVVIRTIPQLGLKAFERITVASAFFASVWVLASHFYFPTTDQFARLFFMFFLGASFYILRDRIILSSWIFAGLIITLLFAVVNKEIFYVIYLFSIAYILFYLAYIPAGLIRQYNKLGDYSYGVYIYAYPTQQSIAAVMPGVSALNMILISSLLTITLAFISWHLLEKRALSYKNYYIGHTRRLLAFWRKSSKIELNNI